MEDKEMELANIVKGQWKDVKKIYVEAFPKKERKPFFMLKHCANKGKIDILVATENNTLLGFIVLVPYKDMIMVDYLAVSNNTRSHGTGSKILKKVCEDYKDKRILLLIEQCDEKAQNNQQRIARKKFYLKNGFISSEIFIHGASGNMEILCWGGNILTDEYLAVQSYSLGRILFALSRIEIVL